MGGDDSASRRAPQGSGGAITRLDAAPSSVTLETMAARKKEPLRIALSAFFERMAARGVKRTKLCKDAKVSEGSIRDYLKGRTETIQVSTIEKLAAAAGVSIGEVIGSGDKQPSTDLAREHMRALLAEVLAFMAREGITLPPKQFAELAMALYGLSIQANPSGFKLTPELESVIRLSAHGLTEG